jgi:hypothetical protein
MTLTHVVSFRFKESVSEADREKVHKDFLHLKAACKRENEGGSYIIDLVGGKKNSNPEGAGKNFDVRTCSLICFSQGGGIIMLIHLSLLHSYLFSYPQHCYVVTFVDADDRDYYVHKDPAHAEFAVSVFPSIRIRFPSSALHLTSFATLLPARLMFEP